MRAIQFKIFAAIINYQNTIKSNYPLCPTQAGEGKTVQRRVVWLISCLISSKMAKLQLFMVEFMRKALCDVIAC
jgi:hypothetical protein